MNAGLKKTFDQIKTIKIQGATNVAIATAKALSAYGKTLKTDKQKEFNREIKKAGRYLLTARATEPMADNVVEFINFYLKKNKDLPIRELKKVLQDSVEYLLTIIAQNNKKIEKRGEKLIRFGDKIFTHCHASTVLRIFEVAKKNKKRFEVFQTETRPLYQGHKTAKDLLKMKIKNTLVVDSAAPFLLSKLSGTKFNVDKLIIGCDAIAKDGSCVNKIGSYGLALTAYLNKIPVYVATQALKMNEDAASLRAVRIEQRSAREVWSGAPKEMKIYNPAFDKIPAEFIKGYICEFGIVKPENMLKKVKTNYKFLF